MKERRYKIIMYYDERIKMIISLREIDESNWKECIFLTTNSENSHNLLEKFVASNALSIAQSKIEQGWTTKAIYTDDIMVGFTMYGFSKENSFYEVCRIMIDHRFQQKGYGKNALRQVINEMRLQYNNPEIYLSFHSDNHVAKVLYEQLGFKDTGRIVDNEILYVLQPDEYH
jgi:diamine N-acetyltransferase